MTHLKRRLVLVNACAVLACISSVAFAHHDAVAAETPQKFKPAVVYYLPISTNEKLDRSPTDSAFVDAARAGIAKASTDYNVAISEYRIKDINAISATLKKAAEDGASPIIALGSQNVAPVLALAERYPNTQFTVIDGLVPPLFPNVQSVLFKDNEGAFLVGIIAARMSSTKRVGFIGGMDNPTIQNFAVGYAQGAKYADDRAEVRTDMVGKTAAAWNNPEHAKELAMQQYNHGVDVIFAAAGGSSLGVLAAANQTHQYAIGVDSNQNGLYPGRVLTSLVKRVDLAVCDTLKQSREGTWKAGIKYLGIREGALDYAVDENNRGLLSEKLIEEVSSAKERIINGMITVNSYSAN